MQYSTEEIKIKLADTIQLIAQELTKNKYTDCQIIMQWNYHNYTALKLVYKIYMNEQQNINTIIGLLNYIKSANIINYNVQKVIYSNISSVSINDYSTIALSEVHSYIMYHVLSNETPNSFLIFKDTNNIVAGYKDNDYEILGIPI